MSHDPYVGSAIDDLPQLWDGFAKLVREGCEITAFGVQVMDLPPDYSTKSHDEADTGQQELYMALRGSGAVVIDDDGQRLTLDPDHVVRVDAGTARTLTSGPDGLRAICVGGIPGAAYEVPDWTHGE
ncbi:MAG: hypothetical protein M3Q53_03435 [Actinomycetota bacterium]|nr:hypothetical protein [Actinomycetota bacterium]